MTKCKLITKHGEEVNAIAKPKKFNRYLRQYTTRIESTCGNHSIEVYTSLAEIKLESGCAFISPFKARFS